MIILITGVICLALVTGIILLFLTKKIEISLTSLIFTLGIPLLILGISYGTYYRNICYYNEFWNNQVIKVAYYEPWDEKVSCRHPEYCTRTVTRTHTDSKGHTYTTTELERYQCGWQHAYDVDFHPEYWEGILDNNNDIFITKDIYNLYKSLWGNSVFIDLHRNFHTIDGNKYESSWNNELLTIFPYTTIHSYKNKIRACPSIFGFKTASKELKEKFKSPAESRNTHVIYNYDTSININGMDEYLQKINASLGLKYQIHNLVLLFNSDKYSAEVINDIKSAWKGPNKNELVTLIGINSNKEIAWCQLMSWIDDTTLHAKIRREIIDLKQFSDIKICNIILDNVKKLWHRKHFADFEFLKFELPLWIIILTFIISVISNIISGIVFFIMRDELFLVKRKMYRY